MTIVSSTRLFVLFVTYCLSYYVTTITKTTPNIVTAFVITTTTSSSAIIKNNGSYNNHMNSRQQPITTTTRLHIFDSIFGGPKDDGSPGDYKCMDCDYVFTKGPKAWAELPDNWSCPTCGSVKRRFKKVPKGSATPAKNTAKKGK